MVRPRTISPPPEKLRELGQEMVDWLYNNDAVHVSDWYCLEKGFTDKSWETMTDRAEFVPYYQTALKIVGRKYLLKDSPVEPNLKQRWQRVYFKDLKKQEDQDLDDAAMRSQKAAESLKANPELLEMFEAHMSMMKKIQNKSKT